MNLQNYTLQYFIYKDVVVIFYAIFIMQFAIAVLDTYLPKGKTKTLISIYNAYTVFRKHRSRKLSNGIYYLILGLLIIPPIQTIILQSAILTPLTEKIRTEYQGCIGIASHDVKTILENEYRDNIEELTPVTVFMYNFVKQTHEITSVNQGDICYMVDNRNHLMFYQKVDDTTYEPIPSKNQIEETSQPKSQTKE